MNEIKVTLHGGLNRFTNRPKTSKLEVKEEATINDICEKLGLSDKDVYLAKLDQNTVKLTEKIGEGKEVDLYPIFGGG